MLYLSPLSTLTPSRTTSNAVSLLNPIFRRLTLSRDSRLALFCCHNRYHTFCAISLNPTPALQNTPSMPPPPTLTNVNLQTPIYAPCMLHACSNYAPRMHPRCSATHSHFLVEQQMQFSHVVFPAKTHPFFKFNTFITLPHRPILGRKCDEYPHFAISSYFTKKIHPA